MVLKSVQQISSASASGAGASGAGGGGPAGALGAVLAMVGKKKKKRQSGITAAKKQYTDKRKVKMAEMRSLKSKRIREFNTKTKKLSKGERDKQRRAYKKKVEAQFKEMQQQFPVARGLKSVAVLRELVRKLQAFKTAK